MLSTVVENPHLQRQIRTLVDPGGTGNYQYVLATGRNRFTDTAAALLANREVAESFLGG